MILAAGLAATTAAGPAAATTATAPPADSAAPASSPPSAIWRTAQPATSPPALAYAAAAYDQDNHTVVLFGGLEPNGTLSDDTWVWDGTNWNDFPNSQPPAREMASMAFDPAQHQLVLFGGAGDGGTLLGDTWAWNGQQWSQLDSGGAGPAPRDGAALGYDSSGALVLFGGTGAAPAPPPPTTTPTDDTSTTAAPPPTDTSLSDTWQWNGSVWTQAAATGPSGLSGAQMSYDSVTGTTVMFSGETTPAGAASPALAPDTWIWDGAAWSQSAPATAPPARDGAVFADDPALGGALLLGGAGAGGGALGDGWVWTAQGWVQVQNSGSPTALAGAAGAFDAATSTFVVFGGIGADGSPVAGTELVTGPAPAGVPPTSQPPPPTRPTITTAPTANVRPKPTNPTTTPKPAPATTAHKAVVPTTVAPLAARPRTMTLVAGVHNVRQGATVQLAGSGFQPGSLITITFHSTPALLGHTVADSRGSFAATVDVPRSARPGEHHFVAQGVSPSGLPAELVAAVYVLGPIRSHGPTPLQTAVMLLLALVIPGVAWTTMTGFGWWRRRRLPVP